MASRNHELENTSAETKPRVPPRPHLFFSNEIRRRRRMYEPVKNSPVPRRAVNPWNNGTGATLDKSGNVVHSRPSRRRDLAGYIFPRDAGARVRVPYVCRVYGKRRSWIVEGGGRGRIYEGRVGGRPRHTHTTKNVDVERSEDWFAGRVPRRYAFYSFLPLFSSTPSSRGVHLNCAFFHGWGAKGWKFLGKREPG